MTTEIEEYRESEIAFQLLVGECTKCGYKTFPPEKFCHSCGREGEIEKKSYCDRKGKLVSVEILSDSNGYYYPALVNVDGVQIRSAITDVNKEELKLDMDLSPTFRRVRQRETEDGVIKYHTFFRPIREYDKFFSEREPSTKNHIGILGYGVHIPKYRIKTSALANPGSLGMKEKAVRGVDEDTITMSVDAARKSLTHAGIKGDRINGIYLGSESLPYDVGSSGTVVQEAIGASDQTHVLNNEFACKGATTLIPNAISVIDSDIFGDYERILVIGSDDSQAEEGDALDYTVGAGAAAFLIGKGDPIATLEAYVCDNSNIKDFWRRPGERHPSHGGRFTGEPAYFNKVESGLRKLLDKLDIGVEDVDHFVLHSPNWKYPSKIAKRFGIPIEKLDSVAKEVGNTYSACTLIGLANILDNAKPGERIFQISYGSGAGVDAFSWVTQDEIEDKRKFVVRVDDLLRDKEYVDYYTYRKTKLSQ